MATTPRPEPSGWLRELVQRVLRVFRRLRGSPRVQEPGAESYAALVVLDNVMITLWAIVDDDAQVIPADLRVAYANALEELEASYYAAVEVLQGRDAAWSVGRLNRNLYRVGWHGAQLDFKLAVLGATGFDEIGNEEWHALVGLGPLEAFRRRRPQPRTGEGLRDQAVRKGGMVGRAVQKLLPAVNSALDSLSDLPGVHAIKEVKGFAESAIAVAE